LILPQSVPVISDAPTSDQDELISDSGLVPQKKIRRDPRPGVLISEPVQDTPMPDEPVSVAQDIQSLIFEEEGELVLTEETLLFESSFTPFVARRTRNHEEINGGS